MVFGEIESFFSIIDRVKRWLRKSCGKQESVATRFVQLFENHGVHRNQIPGFFGHGLTVANIRDDDTLLAVLSEDILNAASELFAIRREWLDGADGQIYPLHDFYKQPDKFIEFAMQIQQQEQANLYGVLIVARSSDYEEDALIVLEETIGLIGDKPVYRYHICNNWFFKYWKARAYLTACIALAWKNGIHIIGREVSIDLIRRYCDGCQFLEYVLDTALPTKGIPWYPEDMAVFPKVFLDGVDPEIKKFDISSGLKLWLQLDEQGLMDTGLQYANVRKKFIAALEKI